MDGIVRLNFEPQGGQRSPGVVRVEIRLHLSGGAVPQRLCPPVGHARTPGRDTAQSHDRCVAANPKVVSSNLTPATISKACLGIGLRNE